MLGGAADRTDQPAVRVLGKAASFSIWVQVFFEIMLAGRDMRLTALNVNSNLETALLGEDIFHAHGEG